MSFLKNLFGGKKDELTRLIENDARIVDVRTAKEFATGHIPGAINIPVQELDNHIQEILDWNEPVIFCCASGMRSAKATSRLKTKGLDCINGGGWARLKKLLP